VTASPDISVFALLFADTLLFADRMVERNTI
jgi:hypothetical protein